MGGVARLSMFAARARTRTTDLLAAWGRRAAIPVPLAAVLGLSLFLTPADRFQARSLGIAVALVLLPPVLLLWRERWPVAVLIACTVSTACYFMIGYPYGLAVLSPLVAAFGAATSGHRASAWIVSTGGLLAILGFQWLNAREFPSVSFVVAHVAGMLVVLIGAEALRMQRTRINEALVARTAQERRRAGEERLHIAQDLHDVLGHTVSLINVQAGVALHFLERDPAQTRAALGAIRIASDDTIREVHSILNVLRQEVEAPRTSAPTLDRIDELIAQCATAGLEVAVQRSGYRVALPPDVELAAYRIVQEALTNVLRHAHVSRAALILDYRAQDLTVIVRDAGTGCGGRVPGSGVGGMRHRAESLGGDLRAGDRPDGGFEVVARLPTADAGSAG
jgi:signal transduction histidine kinase